MRQIPFWFSVLLGWSIFGALSVFGLDFESQETSPERQAELAKLVEQLGAPSWKIRDEAGKKILTYGIDAKGPLEKAAQSEDLTTSRAAKYFLPLISQGMSRVSDPEEVRTILDSYGLGQDQNWMVIEKLGNL